MNISRGPQAFPRSEYLRRLGSVKFEMGRCDIDALVVSDQHNITYLTGYTALSAYVPQAVVVSIREEEPTFILRRCDAPAAIHQCFMERDKIVAYPEAYIGNPDKDGYDAVVDYLEDVGLASRGIGIELCCLPSQSAEKFRMRLPSATIVDATKAVTWIRLIKSDLEIAVMREAAAISDAAILRAAEVIRPGVREADACAEIVATLVRGANGKPGSGIEGISLCSSPRTGTCHIPWSEDVFRYGSQVNLEIGGARYGYCAGLMRTYTIGSPSDRLRRVHEIQVAGLEVALDAIRPGATCSDVANAFNRSIEKRGLKKETRCGYAHGIGWLEPTASLKDGDMTELLPNMTFHLMLGNWIEEDFGYVISETFRVTDSGVEVLTTAPRKIFEI
ncbi:MAG: aminopeptidase P family protein [Mesorhizobium sp.]|uniref:M24 family metallopeptidase n=1 Tax=Mesorhizobium sp. TaxID=1871066 RepID=UPI000FE48B07|nr:Xaa-Pro peptidase family protein [Mesorhizobium sp.]RWI71994.1 MAG: aminopeptidase P family protein [Mesorhizobium sp.]RWJ34551.1 MAG: aminopeptidase P family protein [Mesorhizobium sp.]TIQ16761.1 MAG: aminopeptidase P family protein [Mesorhizobium sp.]TIQ70852.1 MAG: aminopeptidase P family protein [Mesorhizobium sp.]TIW17328.1 MAG: aminopeptidase P family protein [Mesorhizobium sp.]